MLYFLDTNICIYFLKGTYPSIKECLLSHKPAFIKIPSLVKAENLKMIEDFLFPFNIVPFDDKASLIYGNLRCQLEKDGSPVGPNDMIIAATVMACNGTLVTRNMDEFSRIDGLQIEDWSQLRE